MRPKPTRTTLLLLLVTTALGCSDDVSADVGSGTGNSTSPTDSSNPSTDATSGTGATTDTSDPNTAGDGSTGAATTGASTSSDTGDSTGTGDSSGAGDSTGTDDSTGTGGSTAEETGSSSSSGGAMVIDDPFDPESCGGTPLTLADLEASLGGMERQQLATATIQVRERTCAGDDCGDWGEPLGWVITYLTWSGGVTTAYKDFAADMQLVVFDDDGTARLSLQHVTFDLPSSTYDDEDGMVYDLPPAPIGFAHVRAYDDDPDNEYYYRELDWLVRDGALSVGEDCVRWVADPYVQQPPFTEQYALVVHW